ncbi:TCR gamma alternate reading frame protein [Molossus molossus]|uniref:TCR gamma alternate reading frame protein n=1 Tax=Molossus molossus TaxID=27622 RepID=UPI001746530C|nr:TCR gamma alternate reading frame protein [Molossus molossus]
MPLLGAVVFFSFWDFGLAQPKLEQPEISISRAKDKSVHISCKVSSSTFNTDYIHWYRQKPDQSIEHLIYVFSTAPAHSKNNKLEATKIFHSSTSILKINSLEKEDEAVYFCAFWTISGWIKIFAEGTKLIVISPDRSLDSEIYPKPTIFLPSVAEIKLHKAGTHLCLLEKFFPDVIKVYWKEKNSNTLLESQQGITMKTNDTYMKYSWLTVTEKSMATEHKCIVKHENNKRGVDQEIIFPPVKKGVAAINTAMKACVEDTNDTLQLQLTNTSAYYTYLLLLLKSLVYFAIISFRLFRRTAVCGHGKSS